MSGLTTPIDSLPNEILIAILSTLESRELLHLTLVDRRFNAAATAILQQRLLHTVKLEGHEVMLESYHPSARLSTPSMSCRFTGVDFLNHTCADEEDMSLSDLSKLYSHFRPVVSEETRRMRRIYSRRMPAPMQEDIGDEPVFQEISLDEDELFSQLCTTTSLVKTGPRPGIFASHSNIEDGVVRVWRHWLERAAIKCAVAPPSKQQRDESTILWLDATKNVGLRFSVTRSAQAQEPMPVLHSRCEDPPVAYTLLYEGKTLSSGHPHRMRQLTMTSELLVRTSQVLLAMEKSAVQEVVDSGKAIIIASY
ncbi:f-box domain protein [Colletotrichum plurivorum]|uniref:F-box domain protein n=1 Tax=Colletotrichum plurivorum TaxID=2175906 RepID=A0A8H6K0V4_9PEZI|nr:f-box domain protein [Colletotrichum plurivorum]